MTYNVSSGTLNPTHSLTHLTAGGCIDKRCESVLVVNAALTVAVLQGWYIVTYAIGIFVLNQFIAFLTPKIYPAMRDYEGA